ncbi:hypothetical protein [Alkalicoccus saliphilus]|uniref:hypothetical protein n=1 Tax=Alkalicoccus saliphilus TaxID=200989 RepID=UPI001359528B|nr:hypothetical protein [Alkalicoccus saliphilus]
MIKRPPANGKTVSAKNSSSPKTTDNPKSAKRNFKYSSIYVYVMEKTCDIITKENTQISNTAGGKTGNT